MQNAYDITGSMHIETVNIKEIMKKIELPTKNVLTIQREVKIPNLGIIDLLLNTKTGSKYAIEVKKRLTKFEVGELVTYKKLLQKKFPGLKFFVATNKADPIYRTVLNDLDIGIIELGKFSWKERSPKKPIKLSPKEQETYFILQRKGIQIVTPSQLSSIYNISRKASRNILENLNRNGLITRIGKGKYIVISPDIMYNRKHYTADPLTIINELVTDRYYVAYSSALYFHGLANQIPFQTLVALSRQRRSIRVGSSIIKFIYVPKKLMFGYNEEKYLHASLYVSNLEKSILDCVDRHDLSAGITEVTRSISETVTKLDSDKLLVYLQKFNKSVLIQRFGFIIEKLRLEGFPVDPKLIDKLESFKFNYTYPLDFTQSKKGNISRKWKIVENVNCMSWRYA